MKFKQVGVTSIRKKQAIFVTLLGLGLGGCATTTSDVSYADRNNVDVARSRCVQVARTSGYSNVAVDAVERDGQAEWKVQLVARKDGKDRKERCDYDARSDIARLDD